MIAAGIQSLSNDRLPIGWFDGVLLVVIIFGMVRGRKNGMGKELLPLFLWLGMAVGGALGYEAVGQVFINNLRFGQLGGYVSGYLTITVLVWIAFLFLKRAFSKKLEGTIMFGGSEYYLGMISGTVRYVCIVFFVLALLNAPYYTPSEIQARKEYNNRVFGGGQKGFTGDYIPNMQEVQEQVFKKSLVGPFIKDKLDMFLIETAPAGKKASAAPATYS